MYFSKIELRHDSEAVVRAARSVMKNGYRLHQALWQLFQGEHQQRDFLYRRVETTNWPCFYIVSARPPNDTHDLWSIQIKDYTPHLVAGQRLAFSLCVNPIVTKKRQDGKPVRHDVVMDAKKRCSAKKMKFSQAELVQDAGHCWLNERAEKYGFRLQALRVDGYRQHQFSKARGERPIRFSTVDFNGVLTVTDKTQFQQTLFSGIGPAKAFGCGLLLVRRV